MTTEEQAREIAERIWDEFDSEATEFPWLLNLVSSALRTREAETWKATKVEEILAVKNRWEEELLAVYDALGLDPDVGYEGAAKRVTEKLAAREAETWEQAAQERAADRVVLEQAHALVNKASIDRLHHARPNVWHEDWLDFMRRRSALLGAIEERLRARNDPHRVEPQEPTT